MKRPIFWHRECLSNSNEFSIMGIAKCKARIEQEKKQIEKFEKCLLENQEYLKTIELAESKGLGEFDIERFNKPKGKKTKKYEVGE